MYQARVKVTKEHLQAPMLVSLGFKWCTKDCRWERRKRLTSTEKIELQALFAANDLEEKT